jgi:hypothetical protein
LIFAIVAPAAVNADTQEYFGKFIGKLEGVLNPTAQPRPTFTLKVDYRFDDPNGLQWVTPAEAVVDGASIPQAFWSFIGGPFEGEYLSASVIHDHYCRTRTRTAHDTHRNFFYGMRAANVPVWKARFMYWAVSTFGPDWKLSPVVTFKPSCVAGAIGTQVCTQVPSLDYKVVAQPSPDLSNPVTLALALSKAAAVARTLQTSDGKVLDVALAGQIAASDENIVLSSAAYRTTFTDKVIETTPGTLGIMASVKGGENLANIKPWPGGVLPALARAPVLSTQTAKELAPAAAFKIEPSGKDLVTKQVELATLKSIQNFKSDL